MTTITALTDLSRLPNQSQDQAVFDANFAYLVENLPLRAQQENALAANLNSIAAGGAYAIPYAFNGNASVGGGTGRLSVWDSGTVHDAVKVGFDASDSRGINIKSLMDAMFFTANTSSVKGFIKISKQNDPTRWAVFSVSQWTHFPNNGFPYGTLDVVCVGYSHTSPFVTGDALVMQCQRTGDKGDTGVMGVLPRAKFREQRASGTSAGIAVNGANTRDLNTTEFNSISGASLVASSVTLPVGTYDFQGWAMRYSSGSGLGGHKAYLHNVTDNATVSFGSSGSIGTLGINDRSLVSGRFTIAAAKTFQLRHYIEATSGSGQSLGFASSSGFAEVYSEIEFLKVA